MKAFSSHNTALEYWRLHFPLDGELSTPALISHAETSAYTKEDVLECIPEIYRPENGLIDVLVFDSRYRPTSKCLVSHTWSTPIPPNAFYRVHDMYVSSPEFLFLQMASVLTTVQLIALGCELCGIYVLLPRSKRLAEDMDSPPRRSAPLSSVQKIEKFLDSAKGARNIVKARRALRYVIEGSRSPMETRTALQLCLPALLGGYGLPRLVLNHYIPLDEEARRIANRSWCEGDLCWPDSKLDVEYNGSIHSGKAKMRDDAGRILGIEHMGWNVITVTSNQVFDIDQFETVAKKVAKHLKHRLTPRVMGHTQARLTMYEELDAWMEI